MQAQHLAGDEGAFGREEEAQGTFQLVFRAGPDIQQLRGRTVAQLLGQRAAEAFQGPLGNAGQRVV
ncbi:hypothetical protein D3C72_1119780 [compost metagenome]